MHTKTEILRNKEEEERISQDAFRRDEEERIRQEAIARNSDEAEQDKQNKLAAQAQLDMNRLKPIPDLQQPAQLQLSGDNKDWEKILTAFKEKYPETPVVNNALSFATQEEAINFFTAQATATPPAKFLAKEIGADGKPTGFNVFSCGNSKLYQGSLQEIHEQLTADQKANPEDPNVNEGLAKIQRLLNPAQNYRAALQEGRESAQRTEPVHNDAVVSTPNPLSMTP